MKTIEIVTKDVNVAEITTDGNLKRLVYSNYDVHQEKDGCTLTLGTTHGFYGLFISNDDTLNVNGEEYTGNDLFNYLKTQVFFKASGGGGATTLQQALDNGSTLNKDNTINRDGTHFRINSAIGGFFGQSDDSAYLGADDGVNDILLEVTPTAATLTKNGVTKPIATVDYKKYVALLTQTGTDAPVATVLENTLGGEVVWARTDVGDYQGVLSGAFTENKTWLTASSNYITGQNYQTSLTRSTASLLYLLTYDKDGLTSDNINTCVEIRVYP